MRIAYLGLGVIGHAMCGHLLQKYGELTVWNRTTQKGNDLAKKGATQAASPAEAASDKDVVCVCVSDTPDVETVVFGEGGALTHIKDGAVIIDFSTVSAEATEEFSARAAAKGAIWIDAPVSGGDVGARNGTLTIMAGGPQDAFTRVRPILETVGKNITLMGPTGSGQRTKMANQIAVAATIASMAEALNYAREKGMDVQKVLEVISSGAAGSWSLTNYGPRLLKGDYAPGFAASLMAKDMRLVLESLKGLEGQYPVIRQMARIYAQMVEEGDSDLGNHAAALYFGWKRE